MNERNSWLKKKNFQENNKKLGWVIEIIHRMQTQRNCKLFSFLSHFISVSLVPGLTTQSFSLLNLRISILACKNCDETALFHLTKLVILLKKPQKTNKTVQNHLIVKNSRVKFLRVKKNCLSMSGKHAEWM